jgi:uracil-DNA glycosylase
MGRHVTTDLRFHAAQALTWLGELGVDAAVTNAALDRFAESSALAAAPAAGPGARSAPARTPLNLPQAGRAPAPVPSATRRVVEAAPAADLAELEAMAHECATLDDIARCLDGLDACPLKRTATRLCYADGLPGAKLMVIGENPHRQEDEQGRPFTGRSGRLLDAMLAAMGLDRNNDEADTSVFITNTVFWRPPGNRALAEAEIAMCQPFLRRTVELARPRLIITAGTIPARALLNNRQPVTKLRGNWQQMSAGDQTFDVMPILPLSSLLNSSEAKKVTWLDLLSVKARLTHE